MSWNLCFVNNTYSKLDEIVEHYFNCLEGEVIRENLNNDGLAGYLIAISEFYTFLVDKEKWLKYSYFIASRLREVALIDIKNKNYNFIGGLLDIGFSVSLANKKIGKYTNFRNDINNVLSYNARN
ncbi:MAG: hypothetical protein Q4G63_12810, partial [Bacteroidia bacterium]|nr:hypothetical protein [Bacteroidia bacterium]